MPFIADYEIQKELNVIKNENKACLSQIRPTGLLIDLYQEKSRLFRHINFFARRMDFILSNNSCSMATPFPGHSIAGHKGYGIRYRGSTAFEQYQIRLQQAHKNYAHNKTRIDLLNKEDIFWPWQKITKPSIKLIEPPIEFVYPNDAAKLNYSLSKLLEQPQHNVLQILRHVHSAWSSAVSAEYDDTSIFLVRKVLGRIPLDLHQDILLALIFELEFFASYLTQIKTQMPFLGGIFADTWIDVCHRKIEDCRITELCETKRILDELTNLSARGFAPVVINEWNCIADGNHRVIASWIWNILCACATDNWSIYDEAFVHSVSKFILNNSNKMGPLAIHESLRHLAIILNNNSLPHAIKSNAKPNNRIDCLPSVLVLEYCSGAVLKEAYDAENSIVFVSPIAYEQMSKNSNLILSERAIYHFTDCAPLPWFELISSDYRDSLQLVPTAPSTLAFNHLATTL